MTARTRRRSHSVSTTSSSSSSSVAVLAMVSFSLCFLQLMILVSFVTTIDAVPLFEVTSGRPKCFNVEIPKMTMIRIHYDANDIIIDKDAENYAPAYVTVLERPVESAASYSMDDDDGSREESVQNKLNRIKKKNLQRKDSKEPRPISHLLKDHVSSLSVRIQNDAVVDICIRATGASLTNPMMFSLRVEQLGDELTEKEQQQDELDEGSVTKPRSKIDQNFQNNNNQEHHWTFLETQMDKIEHEMHTLIREADFFKDRDSIYHQQTDALHQATTFWPILHIIILLVTGFTQANHIVRFFKAHRII